VIPDEVIENYFSVLFGRSEPGQELHHMLISAAPHGELNALGLPPRDKLQVSMYAIAGDVESAAGAEEFVHTTIRAAYTDLYQSGLKPFFAGLAMEMVAVDVGGDEVTENLARRLAAEDKLEEHPAAVEVTLLYAACRDGRRWAGEHVLTGPRAGTVLGPTLLSEDVKPEENRMRNRLIRRVVGLT
jgi:hypothetical protein